MTDLVHTQLLFNGVNYYVAEITGHGLRGFEIVNKMTGMGGFIYNEVADGLRTAFAALIADNNGTVTPDEADDFLGNYDCLLLNRVVYH